MQLVFVVCILLVVSRTGAQEQCAGTEDGEVCFCGTGTGVCVNEECQCENADRRKRNFVGGFCASDWDCSGWNCKCRSNRCCCGSWCGLWFK
ncbi:metallothionein-like [Mercenaria mercenaria]|uniref:metallothionein-like n=1 Tax=Mercenaria mercenaria TaxID=6596 RepID=UPI00234E6356|nr:metallothionein-like [Mercenaria mercenaria]